MDLLEEFQRNNPEYKLLPFQFVLLTLWGMWSSVSLSPTTKIFYKVFFPLVIFLDTVMCIEMSIFIQKSIKTDGFKLVNIFLTTATMTGIYKAVTTSYNQERIRSFITYYFNEGLFQSQNSEEKFILHKNDLQVRKVIVVYCASMAGIFAMRAFSPMILETNEPQQLPVDAWYPYDLQKWYFYWLTYMHQVVLGSSLICVHIGVDTLFVGLLLKLACQIDILKCRVEKIPEMCMYKGEKSEKFEFLETKLVFQCIKQHQILYRFGKDLNTQFQELLLIQVVTSIPNLCINIYVLSTATEEFDIDHISILFNTTSSLIQLFISCWYGNEVILKCYNFKDAIYKIDWTELSVSTQKLLIIMMLRSSKPIEFTVGYIIPMNIDSFIKIVKTSYSAFNLLQQT